MELRNKETFNPGALLGYHQLKPLQPNIRVRVQNIQQNTQNEGRFCSKKVAAEGSQLWTQQKMN